MIRTEYYAVPSSMNNNLSDYFKSLFASLFLAGQTQIYNTVVQDDILQLIKITQKNW